MNTDDVWYVYVGRTFYGNVRADTYERALHRAKVFLSEEKLVKAEKIKLTCNKLKEKL